MSNNKKKEFEVPLPIIAIEMAGLVVISGLLNGIFKEFKESKSFEGDKNIGNYSSGLYDSFDCSYKQDITGKYYVLKLRDAYKASCSSTSSVERNDAYKYYSNINPETCLWYEQQSYDNGVCYITDEWQVPKYLLLTGTNFELIHNVPEGSMQYAFTGRNEDYTSVNNWNTEIALLRDAKDDFNIFIWGSEYGVRGQLTLEDSYIVPLSSLTKEEIEDLILAYDNNEEVIKIVDDVWFGSLIGNGQNETEESVMANGFTKEENAQILRAADIAGVKSRILRRRGI